MDTRERRTIRTTPIFLIALVQEARVETTSFWNTTSETIEDFLSVSETATGSTHC